MGCLLKQFYGLDGLAMRKLIEFVDLRSEVCLVVGHFLSKCLSRCNEVCTICCLTDCLLEFSYRISWDGLCQHLMLRQKFICETLFNHLHRRPGSSLWQILLHHCPYLISWNNEACIVIKVSRLSYRLFYIFDVFFFGDVFLLIEGFFVFDFSFDVISLVILIQKCDNCVVR